MRRVQAASTAARCEALSEDGGSTWMGMTRRGGLLLIGGPIITGNWRRYAANISDISKRSDVDRPPWPWNVSILDYLRMTSESCNEGFMQVPFEKRVLGPSLASAIGRARPTRLTRNTQKGSRVHSQRDLGHGSGI